MDATKCQEISELGRRCFSHLGVGVDLPAKFGSLCIGFIFSSGLLPNRFEARPRSFTLGNRVFCFD